MVANLILHFVECDATIEATTKIEKCVFPFEHDDKEYYTCISKNSDKPWCKTETKVKGICHSGCPGDFNSTYYFNENISLNFYFQFHFYSVNIDYFHFKEKFAKM